MSVFSSTYPISIIILIIAFLLGISICLIFLGSITFIVIILLISIGSLRIMPIINLLNKFIQKIYPEKINRLNENIKKSFPIFYSNKFINLKNAVINAEDSPKYIYLFHPHGLFTISHYLHIGTHLTDWQDKKIKGTALHILWYLPFGKELMETYGFVQSNYQDMKQVLSKNSLSVTLGGVKEMDLREDNKIILNIAKKQGVFKIAIETGTPIVPVIVYGENELYKLWDNYFLKKFNKFLLKYNLYLPIPTFESCYKWFSLFYKPLDKPVTTYVGEPIFIVKKDNPTEKDIVDLREQYFSSLRKLYKNTRPEYYDKDIFIV